MYCKILDLEGGGGGITTYHLKGRVSLPDKLVPIISYILVDFRAIILQIELKSGQ